MSYTRLGPGGYPVQNQFNAQSIIPSLYVDGDATFSPIVSQTQLVPLLYVDADAFYSPFVPLLGTATKLGPGGYPVSGIGRFFAQSISPQFFIDADTVYTASEVGGVLLLISHLVVDADQFIVPAVSTSTTLTASLYDATDTLFAPSVFQFASVLPDFYLDDDTLYVADVSQTAGAQSISPDVVVDDTDDIFAPIVSAIAPVRSAPVIDGDVIYAPVISEGPIELLPARAFDVDQFGASVVLNINRLFAAYVASDDLIRQPNAARALVPARYADAEAFYSAQVAGGAVIISPSRFVAADVIYVPAVQYQKKQGGGGGGNPGGLTKDIKYVSSMVMGETGEIIAVEIDTSVSNTVNTRAVIYSDVGGLPYALLAKSFDKTSVVAGANVYNLVDSYVATAGQKIWVGVHTDGNIKWFLSNSPLGSRFGNDLFSDGPSDPFGTATLDNKKAPIFVIYLLPANATMSPPLYIDVDAFFSPSISSRKTLVSSLFAPGDSIWPATVGASNAVIPRRIASDDAVYAPAISTSVTLTAGLVVVSDIVLSPDVGRGAGYVFSPPFAGDDVIFAPVVETEGANLGVPLFVAADAIYGAVTAATYDLSPDLVDDLDSIESSSIDGSIGIAPSIVVSLDDIVPPLVSYTGGNYDLTVDLIEDRDSFYRPAVGHISPRQIARILAMVDAEDRFAPTVAVEERFVMADPKEQEPEVAEQDRVIIVPADDPPRRATVEAEQRMVEVEMETT